MPRSHHVRPPRRPPRPLEQWMAEALLGPDGTYGSEHVPIGENGDFITSPEISQLFGELIGIWLVANWHHAGMPAKARLVELGPGRGTLLVDALRAMRVEPACRAAFSLILVETSPGLRARQSETLARAGLCASWQTDALLALTEGEGPCFVLANEFFDALPARQYQLAGGEWRERLIGTDEQGNGRFELGITVPKQLTPPHRPGLSEGAIIESRPAAWNLGAALGETLSQWGGAALLIDYGHHGYNHPDTPARSTLRGVARHKPVDPLVACTGGDLSIDVDFASLAEAIDTKARTLGPVRQGDFLRAMGIDQRLAQLCRNQPASVCAQLQGERDRLVSPAGTGSFLVLGAVPEGGHFPPGFPPPGFSDQIDTAAIP